MKNLNVWMLLACVSLLSGCDEALDDGPDGGADTSTGDGGATLKSLVAKSGGVEIGIILEMDPYRLRIWDREHDLLFTLNQVTGNVCGNPPSEAPRRSGQLFGDANCYSDPIGVSRVDDRCPGSPVRREAWGLDNGYEGTSRATAILAYSGAPTEQVWQLRGRDVDLVCESTVNPGLCFLPTGQTSEIPTHFSLPIEVVER